MTDRIEALRAEITTDPAGLGYAALVAADADASIVAAVNAVREGILVDQLVPRHAVKTLLYGTGEMLAIKMAQEPSGRLAAMYLDDPDYENVDLTLPVVQGLLASLLGAGLLSQGTVDAIQSMGKRPGSRAEQIGLGVVSCEDVSRAVRDDYGNKLVGG